jgi:hypothetical protein
MIGTVCDVDGADCDILTVRFLDGMLGEEYSNGFCNELFTIVVCC